jgi:hypothetical protein
MQAREGASAILLPAESQRSAPRDARRGREVQAALLLTLALNKISNVNEMQQRLSPRQAP